MREKDRPEVIHIVTTLERGGAEKQLLVLCQEQANLGLKVTVYYLKGKGELEKDFSSIGVTVGKIDTIKKTILLREQLKRKKGLPIHCHLPRAEIFGFAIIIFTNNLLFVSRHNAEQFYKSVPKFLSSFISQLILRRATSVIAISWAVRQFILEYNEISKKDYAKISVVHYGFNPEFSLSNNSKRASYENVFRIGTIARLTKQKDLKTLINGFDLWQQEFPNSELFILGEGEERFALQDLVSEKKLGDKIHLLGRNPDVVRFLESLDVFVLSSQYEGFGLVLLEAMQSNVPILCTNVSALPEVMGRDYQGFFQPGNSRELFLLLRKCQDLEFTSKLTENYRARLDQFNPKKMALRIVSLYGHQ
jgi:glycosyltransferase involved in cell wall biosynthesis